MAKDIGLDLGTSYTNVFIKGKGVVLSEPSIVAVNKALKKPIAVGSAAEKMIGRTPANIETVRPIRDGAIADFELAEFMVQYFMNKACGKLVKIGTGKLLVSVPTTITEVEQLAVLEVCKTAAHNIKTRLIEEPLAAAVGAELPLGANKVEGSMIVDIGGGTAEVAVFSFGEIIKGESVKVGGEKFDEQIINYMKTEHDLLIGDKTAETVKKEVGCVFPQSVPKYYDVCGRDILNGLPSSVRIESNELLDCLKEPAILIVDAAKRVLEGLPPEISADVARNGIVLSGGGALLTGFAEFMRTETNVPVKIAKDPQKCVALGTGRCLYDSEMRSLINAGRI